MIAIIVSLFNSSVVVAYFVAVVAHVMACVDAELTFVSLVFSLLRFFLFDDNHLDGNDVVVDIIVVVHEDVVLAACWWYCCCGCRC